MKASELRIGNYLNGKQGPVAVSEIRENNRVKIYDIASSFTVGTCLPFILLTEEWLFKFDFVYDGANGYDNKSFHLEYISFLGFVFFIQDEVAGPSITVQYVHQLQNLYFALTGEELTLNQ